MFTENLSLSRFLLICFKFKTSLKLLFLFILFSGSFSAQQSDFQFSHLTTEDGLSLNVITNIYQDSWGFLWIATYNGLNRYDGYNFKTFLPEAAGHNSILSHSVLKILEDKDGYLWIATNEGLNKYDRKKEKFYKYQNNTDDKNSISSNYIYSLFVDSDGTLWVGTSDGLNKYNKKNDNFTVYKVNDIPFASSLNSINSIEEDYQGNIWAATWDGLSCINKEGKIINQFWSEKNNKNSLSNDQVSVLLRDDDYLWIGTNGGGLNRYDFKKRIFTHFRTDYDDNTTISDDFVTVLYKDEKNDLWVGTKSGLNKFDRKTGKFNRIFHDPLKPLSLINNDVRTIYEDQSNILWIGTTGGLSKLVQFENVFKYYQENKLNSKISLSNNRVNSVFVDKKGNIWAGTRDGLDKITKENKIFHYKFNNKNKNSLSHNSIYSITEDHEGIIWIGTDGGGLNRLNPVTGEFKLYKYIPGNEESLINDGIPCIFEDSKSNLWIGTYYGINLYNKNTDNFLRFKPDPNNKNSLRHGIVWVIFEDSEGYLWIGTDGGGVSRFNTSTHKFRHFLYDSLNNRGSLVYSIYESKDGLMWFGTTEGLYYYNRENGKQKLYTKDDGLPSNAVNSIIEDRKGYMWLSSDKGITKFNRKNGDFFIYTKRNGLRGNEFGISAVAKSDDGILYYGTSDGLLFFDPDSIKDYIINTSVVFTDFKIFNQSVPVSDDGSTILNESITSSSTIRKLYNHDVITIEYALLDFFNVKSNKFLYKLEGFEKEWNDVGNRNNAVYNNLPPGEYVFHLKAFNNNGIRNIKETSLQLIIEPLFYQTWWFRIGFVSSGILAAFLIFKLRTNKIEKQNKFLEKKIAEHTKDLDKTINELSQEILERKKAEAKVQSSLEEKEVLLKEIHHRVKNNLQVISSLLYLNSKKISDKEVLNMFQDSQNRVKSIALVHERLYQSKDLGNIDLKEYVQKLTADLFRSYAVNQSIIGLEININNVFINIDTAIPCGLIINELLSNSLKYAFPDYEENGKKGKIKIDIQKHTTNELIIIVSDNGVSIDGGLEAIAIKKKKSLGLQLVDTLVAQLEGKLEIDLSSGTLFKIQFKYS